AQVQEEAARNHVAIDQAEIASIHQKAIEFGKLRALEQARDTIHGQVEDLEVQRAELALVGASKLAHDRIISALKTEQEIRKLGIPLYGQEANEMRANTAAASALADATARASLQQQLQFDREQMFRSPTEQNIASTMRGAGLDYDPNSAIAQQIRYNEQLKTTKAAWEDIFSTVNDGIDGISDALFSGGSITDALKKAGQQLAKTMFDMSVTNPLKNWLTGANANTIADLGIFGSGASSGKGGGFGGVLGQMLGAQKAVASMQVQAASVFVNGSPIGGIPGLPGAANDNGSGGILGWVKSLFGGANDNQPFKADTTLTDFLGGGGGPNTAATASKLLSGLGSPLGGGGGGASAALSQIFASAGVTKTGIPLSGIGIDGLTAKVASEYAGRFQGLLNDLKGAGYPITSLGEGGYSFRNVAGTNNLSNHAFGNALDINPRQNPWAVGAKGNFSQYGVDPNALAEKNGLFWGGNWNKSDAMHFQVNKNVDMGATNSIEGLTKLGSVSFMAAESLQKAGLAGFETVKGLTDASGGLTQFGSMLSSFMGPGGGSGSGWFQNLAGMFGGPAGAINSMKSISPLATADILSGSWGLFDTGGRTGGNDPRRVAGLVHEDEYVFSSPAVRAIGVDTLDRMHEAGKSGRGYAGGGLATWNPLPMAGGRSDVVDHQPLRTPRAAN
ncbi:M15 family peptidase, partial [Mesorhizobium sp. M7D.F.Ca.US.004.03.1.1]